ncbi:MAG: alpha/beta fold hydrolase, partial [Bacteroidota bacterium]
MWEKTPDGPDSLLWDLPALMESPHVRWGTEGSPVRSLIYSGISFEGQPTEIFAYYANPRTIGRQDSPDTRYPGVVLVHGGGGKAYREWVEKWATAGYAAIAMDLGGKDGNGQVLAQAGPGQGGDDKYAAIAEGLTSTWSYHAVAAVIQAHSLLCSFPEVDAQRTAITGISWGGYLTCIVAGLDHRFQAACPVYGCAFFDQCEDPAKALQKLSPLQRSQWMKWLDPQHYLPLATCPLLFVNGNRDFAFSIEPYHHTYQLLPDSQTTIKLTPDM